MNNIQKLRLARNLTQEALSMRAGISRQTLSALESGNEVNTTIGTLTKIANALECKVSDIFFDENG
ncbi:MAG: helix-turn-helix transcriptional regulator [Selenomonadales bacterium]|nr:helix-turn-helix transcriptional regulator [Selenomonadales bacterium]